MKELWLVCNNSHFTKLQSAFGQRIENGEIDFLVIPSEQFPFNTCKLPHDLNDKEDVRACVEAGFGDYNQLMDGFEDLANVNTADYDKFVVCVNKNAISFMFLSMVCYFLDAPITIMSMKDFATAEFEGESREAAEMIYKEYINHRGNVFCYLHNDSPCLAHKTDLNAVLMGCIGQEFCNVDSVIDSFREKARGVGFLHPMFVGSVIQGLAARGFIKVRSTRPLEHPVDIGRLYAYFFCENYKVRALSQEEAEEKLRQRGKTQWHRKAHLSRVPSML